MSTFLKVFKVEAKLGMRCIDSVFFGVIMPAGVFLLIAALCGSKPAYDGSSYTMLEASFGALITVGICATAFMGIPLTIADYRDKKILKHFFVTPTSPLLLLGSHFVLQVLLSICSAGIIFLLASICYGYRIKGSVVLFLLSYFFVMVAMYSLGMAIASVCKTVKATNVVCTVVYFPMLFLSGATIPYEVFPTPLQKIAEFLPLTQGIKLLKESSLGIPVGNLTLAIIVLASSCHGKIRISLGIKTLI